LDWSGIARLPASGPVVPKRRPEVTMSTTTDYQDYRINPRIKIAALWTSMLLIFAYVDLFGAMRE
jgi:hypothetical protein